jgi:DNA-binding NarL/FixJ family response regulator
MPQSILLVDDHKILRDGIRAIIEKSADFLVIGEADNGLEAVSLCRKLHPDMVLMDIGLPEMNGITATAELLRHCPTVKVVILSIYDDKNSVVAAFRSGVRAFLLKKASSADLLDALSAVSRGGSYLSSEVADRLLSGIQCGDLDPEAIRGPLDGLTPREQEVLRLLARGKTSKEIANMLELGLQTVRTYRKTLMKKIGVSNIAGLTRVALKSGLGDEWETH